MKFSTAAVIFIANGIAAMPWSLGSPKSDKKSVSIDDGITLQIKISKDEVRHQKKMHPREFDICWLACFSQQPECPEGWYAKKSGEGGDDEYGCWTCCRGTDEL